MLDGMARLNGHGVISALKEGKSIKITVDNIDGRIVTNQVYTVVFKTNATRRYYFFKSITPIIFYHYYEYIVQYIYIKF